MLQITGQSMVNSVILLRIVTISSHPNVFRLSYQLITGDDPEILRRWGHRQKKILKKGVAQIKNFKNLSQKVGSGLKWPSTPPQQSNVAHLLALCRAIFDSTITQLQSVQSVRLVVLYLKK